jgi:hypothetical protein
MTLNRTMFSPTEDKAEDKSFLGKPLFQAGSEVQTVRLASIWLAITGKVVLVTKLLIHIRHPQWPAWSRISDWSSIKAPSARWHSTRVPARHYLVHRTI